jgi:hypothetical protein
VGDHGRAVNNRTRSGGGEYTKIKENEMIIEYAVNIGAKEEVIAWLNKNASKLTDQTETEHLIDYFVAKEPKLKSMTHQQAKSNCDKWLKALMKKGLHIKETEKDTETILDFKDGFIFKKLIGENAYKREGFLMSHCVASYYGKDDEIYSLRDKKNIPHCTISKNSQQIKGKGNGSIDPKYIKYVVEFLEHLKVDVRDSEMANLGYVNISEVKEESVSFKPLFRDKYFYKANFPKIKNKDKISLWSIFGIFSFNSKLEVRFNFNIQACISSLKEKLSVIINKNNANEVAMNNANKVAMNDSNEVAMNNANEVAMNDYNKVAMDNANEVAMSNDNEVAMNNYNKVAMDNANAVAMNNYNKVAMNNANEVAMNDYNKVAMRNYNRVAMNNYNKVAMNNYNRVAMDDSNEVAMSNDNEVAMNNYNKVAAGTYCILAGSCNNRITIKNKSLAVMGDGSAIKGAMGAWLVLYQRDNENNIICVKTAQVDNRKIKADTWYSLKDGDFKEETPND